MISISLKSKRPKGKFQGWLGQQQNHNTYSPSYLPTTALTSNTEMFNEARRRDNVIKNLLKDLKYKEGDHVKPWNQKGVDEMGDDCVVIKICDSYAKFGKTEEWPVKDSPLMLVHAFSNKTKTNFHCTPQYLVPKT